MFILLKTINTCQLTPKALIKLPLTIESLSPHLPARWLSSGSRKCLQYLNSCQQFFIFFFSFLVSFLQFFYFYLVLELFIDDLKIIFMVCIILQGSLRSKGLFSLLVELQITHWFAFDILRNIIFSNYFQKIIVKFCELFVFSSKLLKFFCCLAIANRLKFEFRIMKFRSQIGVFFG